MHSLLELIVNNNNNSNHNDNNNNNNNNKMIITVDDYTFLIIFLFFSVIDPMHRCYRRVYYSHTYIYIYACKYTRMT